MIGPTRRHGDFSAPKGQVSGDIENQEELPHSRGEEDSAGKGEISVHNDPGGHRILCGAKPVGRDEGRDCCGRFPCCDFIESCRLRVQRQCASTRWSQVGSYVRCRKRTGKGQNVCRRSRGGSWRSHRPKQPESSFRRIHLTSSRDLCRPSDTSSPW